MLEDRTVSDLVKAADEALLQAKAAGKARVVSFDEIDAPADSVAPRAFG